MAYAKCYKYKKDQFVRSVDGKQVFNKRINLSYGVISGKLSTENWSPGLYFIEARIDNEIYHQKVIVE